MAEHFPEKSNAFFDRPVDKPGGRGESDRGAGGDMVLLRANRPTSDLNIKQNLKYVFLGDARVGPS